MERLCLRHATKNNLWSFFDRANVVWVEAVRVSRQSTGGANIFTTLIKFLTKRKKESAGEKEVIDQRKTRIVFEGHKMTRNPFLCTSSSTTPTSGLPQTYSFPRLSLRVDMDEDVYDILQKQVRVLESVRFSSESEPHRRIHTLESTMRSISCLACALASPRVSPQSGLSSSANLSRLKIVISAG
jgi:hypothetical protein